MEPISEPDWVTGVSRAAALKGGPVWLVTFATYHRHAVFESSEALQRCAGALEETCTRNGYRVYALVVMPDHVHAVLDSGVSGHLAPKVVNNLKGVTSRRVFQGNPELKLDLHSQHLWADEYQTLPLPTYGRVRQACQYVEANPAKLGLPRQHYGWVSPYWPAL